MNKISAVIISKDSELVIKDCLESLKFCDEIILIDSGTTDKTVKIAKDFGAKTFKISDLNFAEARNLGVQKASFDWVLYVDTDERVSSVLARNIKKIIKETNYSAFKLKRKNFYFGNHEWPYIEKLERLFRKVALKGWYGKIHESPIVEGKIGDIDGFIFHYTHRDLSSMIVKTIEWSKIEAEIRFKANHPKMSWWRFPRVMLTAFFDSYIKQGGFKVGIVGLLESIYQAFSIFVTYARLWELQNRNEFRK